MKIIEGRCDQSWRFSPNDSANWSAGELYGWDTETTAVEPKTARIVTAAIVREAPDGTLLETREWLCNPGIEIPLNATAVHGVSTEEARTKGQDAETTIREIVSQLDGMTLPLVTVNAAYDFTILRQEMIRLGIGRLEDVKLPPIIDSLVCDRRLDIYRPGRRSLTATTVSYGIAIRGAHTAFGDIVCSLKLVRAMARKYPVFASCDLTKLQEMQAMAHNDWCVNFERFRRIDDCDFMVSRGWPYQVYDSEMEDQGCG